jgi:pimeloyl-ACP methyl ester carboxylesterase
VPVPYRYSSLESFLTASELTVDGTLDDGWGASFAVKGRELDATILFADISNFSERTADLTPTETLAYVNNFFAWISAEALRGTTAIVDKYIGDEVMAIYAREFGSTDPFVDAIQAARWMCEHDALDFGPHIGIASGRVIVGYVGTPVRHGCSVFGAPVALAECCVDVPAHVSDGRLVSHTITFPSNEWGARAKNDVIEPVRRRDPVTGAVEDDEFSVENMPAATRTDRVICVEARVLEYDRTGTGEPPVVLLPGGLTGWQSWLPLVPALSMDRGVVRVQPICNAEGLAGRPGDTTYDAEVERQSIGMTLNEAGVSEMHLVGWSNGGRIALDFALANPERVLTLTLIEPAAYWLVADEDETARSFHEYLVRLAGRDLTDDDLREFLVRAGLGSEDTDFASLPQWGFWSSCRQALSWGGEKMTSSAAAGIEGFEGLDIPTLVICGRSTSPWLRGVAKHLAREMPEAKLVELEGGHACILEHPEDFVGALSPHIGAA